MKNKKNKKAFGQRIHFKNRLKERYGLDINREQIEIIINDILDGNAIKIFDYPGFVTTNRTSLYKVILPNNELAFVVYDKFRRTLVTALPLDPDENYLKKHNFD